ncbi:hypothetical protein NDQ53_14355 [Rossellomorea marisflavi]|uniref:HGGxSTG domain-containing protein n=1 Tax=Rossellomorea marisflavi TaxID=189381 RepID=UPI0020409CB2|nr:HGGxSTG domain-containing protein [Rossellomorea marisflavi]MCM2590481.1 hypothetical protein [Rossellomorea marisflavi]
MSRPFKEDPELVKIVKEAEESKLLGDEVKLKLIKKKLKKQAKICGAVKGNGRVCLRKPHFKDDGSTNGRCQFHSGKSTGPKTLEGREKALKNLNPKAKTIHGIYSKDFKETLTEEEVGFYNYSIDWFFENFKEDASSPVNLSLFDRFIMNFIKQGRKDAQDFLSDSKTYNDFESKLIRFAETLGLNRKFEKSRENSSNSSNKDIALLFMDEDI